jgi:predicted RNA-binding protein (virulence factor B family)
MDWGMEKDILVKEQSPSNGKGKRYLVYLYMDEKQIVCCFQVRPINS